MISEVWKKTVLSSSYEVKQLNSDLKDSARLEGVQGRYHLRIFDPVSYKKEYEKICRNFIG